MKKLVKILIAVIVAIVIIFTAVYAYYGGFRSIDLKVEDTGGELFVYTDMTGDYKQIPAYMDSVYYYLLDDLNIATTKGVGIYYDDPKHVETSKLRSQAGCFLDAAVDSAQKSLITQKYKIKEIPKTKYITAELPNKGVLSVMVGIVRVYPAITKYQQENGYKDDNPIMEIYNVPTGMIEYRKEIRN